MILEPPHTAVVRAALDAGESRCCLVVEGDRCEHRKRFSRMAHHTTCDGGQGFCFATTCGCDCHRVRCQECGGRLDGKNETTRHVAPAVWVKLDQKCELCKGTGRYKPKPDKSIHLPHHDLGYVGEPSKDCPNCFGPDHRQVHELRETCPKCHGDYSYRECDHCQNGSVLRARAAVKVLTVVRRPDNEDGTGLPAVWVLIEGQVVLVLSGTDHEYLTLDPRPRPGVDFVILLEFAP